ncbi:hypothetical protein WH87_04755 [Devosia epidermidihirudinis]|uniref:Uncharacterized protein n=1 Tax=Devosia epidermidihirudinis TaxID=1293439 RepID=A0A0F5QHL0_9HYPH|nr:hypothetical protein [Devosia epidermidihirudinis]KKC39509.1 hypothetical protein WH87_04755 [Devosia epidermidihirudinis]
MAIEKFDYTEAARDAAELLQEFGQIGAIRRFTEVPGPDEFTPGTQVEVDYPIIVAVLPIDLQNVGRDMDGTLIKADDKQLLISPDAAALKPTTTDLVLIDGAFAGASYVGGTIYSLVRCNALAPAGRVVLYDAVGTR